MDLSSIQSLFTPSVLFVLLNVVIGTIAVLSSRHHHRSSHGGGGGSEGGGGDQQQQQQRSIARSSSSNVMERIRSLGLFRFRSGDLQPVNDDHHDHIDNSTMDQNHQQQQQFRRIQSESDSKKMKKKDEESDAAATATTTTNSKMKKSVSEKVEIVRRPPAMVDEEVDAKADDFINKFRQQLKLQRLDSLLRYKEMLTGKRN